MNSVPNGGDMASRRCGMRSSRDAKRVPGTLPVSQIQDDCGMPRVGDLILPSRCTASDALRLQPIRSYRHIENASVSVANGGDNPGCWVGPIRPFSTTGRSATEETSRHFLSLMDTEARATFGLPEAGDDFSQRLGRPGRCPREKTDRARSEHECETILVRPLTGVADRSTG